MRARRPFLHVSCVCVCVCVCVCLHVPHVDAAITPAHTHTFTQNINETTPNSPGPSFVSRLEGMMSDLNISRDTNVAWVRSSVVRMRAYRSTELTPYPLHHVPSDPQMQQESAKSSPTLRGFNARVLTQGTYAQRVPVSALHSLVL